MFSSLLSRSIWLRELESGFEMELTIDVFMLNRFPCRMVELVGWVAGVDEKEKTQTIYRMSSAFSSLYSPL